MLGWIIQFVNYPLETENPKLVSLSSCQAFGSSPSVFQMVHSHGLQTHINVSLVCFIK